MHRSNPVLWWLAVLFPAMLASYSIALRHRVESLNKAVTIAVEADAAQALASSQGIALEYALANLKAQGLRAVAVSEETLGELIARMQIEVVPGRSERAALQLQDVGLAFRDPELRERVRSSLLARFPVSAPPDGPLPRGIPASLAEARSTSLGLDPLPCRIARDLDLDVIARLGNPLGVREAYVDYHLDQARANGARYFLPSGDQVLGRRDLVDYTANALNERGIFYATPEFAKIGGDSAMVAGDPGNVVRLHAAQAAEIDKLSVPAVVERYAKAARERNIRILLLRPATNAAERPLTAFAALVKDTGDAVVREGGALGIARPFEDSAVPRWLFLVLGLSFSVAAGMLAFDLFSRPWAGATTLAAVALGALCWTEPGRGYGALFAAVLYPCFAYWVLDRMRPGLPIVGFLLVSLISLVGGMSVAGLLNGLPFFVKADEFAGIKIATFLPIVLVGGFFFHRLAGLPGALKSPITWGSAGLGIVLAGAVAFMLSRTGNDNPAGVSGLELAFRDLLDRVLFVRPRTKEFLIGHPALFLGAAMLAQFRAEKPPGQGYAGWTALALMLGAIGSTSIVNTLCHLHTPVALSLARVLLGVTVGCILGTVLALVGRRWIRGYERTNG